MSNNLKIEENLESRLRDLDTPTVQIEFNADEADILGACEEDALSMNEAKESAIDLQDAL